jgi:signal transduction histidine kinase
MSYNIKVTVRIIGIAILFSVIFWVADSAYGYYFFAERVRYLLFQEPLSFLESLILKIPPHDLFVRISFAFACVLGGVLISKYIIDLRRAEDSLREYSERLEEMVEERTCELETTQEELIQREKLATFGRLAGSVAHELRNPLGVISNAVYLLRILTSEKENSVRDNLDLISEEVTHSADIISELFKYSEISEAYRKSVAIISLVNNAIDRAPIPENIEVLKDIPTELSNLLIDEEQIGQVFENIIENAIEAMPDGGRLSIETKEENNRVTVTISDTGIGIAPEDIEKLFEPLFTTKVRGIGLGLAITKKLIEANNGQIEVQSELNKGTRFITVFKVEELLNYN